MGATKRRLSLAISTALCGTKVQSVQRNLFKISSDFQTSIADQCALSIAPKTTKPSSERLSPVLQALTAAAMLLPGLSNTLLAADDEVTIQYGHYEEEKRDIYGRRNNTYLEDFSQVQENSKQKITNPLKPITVDSMHVQGKTTLMDRWKFTANYAEDTWSGATPVATGPSSFGGNNLYFSNASHMHEDVGVGKNITGASPYLQTLVPVFDRNLNPVLLPKTLDDVPVVSPKIDRQLTHTMAMASPETRKQGDFKLGYEWDEAAVDVGGGLSVENDYESRFVNWGGRLDFNSKLTTLNFNQSYTNSTVRANIDHDALPYLSTAGYALGEQNGSISMHGDTKQLNGRREDIATGFSLTQVLSKSALAETGVSYTHSSGYMENPYKSTYVFLVEPTSDLVGNPLCDPSLNDGLYRCASTTAFAEQRPDNRNQINLNLRYVQHVEPLDAAMNLKYNYFFDDWGINAHTFEGKWVQPLPWGLTVTPTIRYYSQSAADFYHPFLALKAAGASQISQTDEIGAIERENYQALSDRYSNFSSDHRLSAYGALSGGVVVNKKFARGLDLEMGFEYYTHQGSLKMGGGGEADYADFSGFSASAALKVNLATMGRSMFSGEGHEHHHHHDHGAAQPAGLMLGHMLEKADEWMVGYNYMYSRQAGDLLQGTQPISDSAIIANNMPNNPNCADVKCYVTPKDMIMHMHMFMVMYAPTDWMNLMLMPTFMDMSMNMRPLSGVDSIPGPLDGGTNGLTGSAVMHADHEHQTGGIGDTNISALFKLFKDSTHQLNLGLGVSAPTGAVDIGLRPNHGYDLGYIHYGMQLGSGTWDFTPSLTYSGHHDDWGWGAQIQGIKRMETQNESGYALGDMLQATTWGSYRFVDWLSGTVRGIYTTQGALQGEYTGHSVPIGTMDSPNSYGGRYWDLGVGLSATIPRGDLAGNTFSVEWLQPLQDDVNGVQLERDGALAAKWNYMF